MRWEEVHGHFMRTILSLLPPSTHIDAAADRNIIFLAESIMQQAARRREIKDKVQTVVVIRTRGYMLKNIVGMRPVSLPFSHLNHNLNLPFERISHPYASSLKKETAVR